MTRIDVSSEELARAARLLVVRSRREATGLFAGNYVSAFRGMGLEDEIVQHRLNPGSFLDGRLLPQGTETLGEVATALVEFVYLDGFGTSSI